jgi:hypothetical protein
MTMAAGVVALAGGLTADDGRERAEPTTAATPAGLPAWAMAGDQHRVLDYRAGTWAVTVRFFRAEGEPAETAATSTQEWVLGGRYLRDTTRSNWSGAPFEGIGVTAYDVIRRKYVHSWIDNFSTAITVLEGDYDAASGELTFVGESLDPASGKFVRTRWVEQPVDADHWIARAFRRGEDGRERLATECAYERVREGTR